MVAEVCVPPVVRCEADQIFAKLTDEGGSYCGCGKEVSTCKASVDSIAPVRPP